VQFVDHIANSNETTLAVCSNRYREGYIYASHVRVRATACFHANTLLPLLGTPLHDEWRALPAVAMFSLFPLFLLTFVAAPSPHRAMAQVLLLMALVLSVLLHAIVIRDVREDCQTLSRVLVHEVGHSLGLEHIQRTEDIVTPPVMYKYAVQQKKMCITESDGVSHKALYGVAPLLACHTNDMTVNVVFAALVVTGVFVTKTCVFLTRGIFRNLSDRHKGRTTEPHGNSLP